MFPYLNWPIYSGWVWNTPVVPNMYWNVYSAEQRWKNACLNIGKMGAYLDNVAETTNEWADGVVDEMNAIDKKVDDFEEFATEHGYMDILSRISVLEELEESYNQYKMLVIGDSWSTDLWNVPANKLWCKYVADAHHKTLVNVAVSGSGYMSAQGSFMAQFENSKNLIDDPGRVSHVFVFGSLNDRVAYESSSSDYITTVRNTLTAIKNWYSNSRIIVVGAQQPINAVRNTMLMSTNYLKPTAIKLGLPFIDMTWVTIGLPSATDPNYSYHPTEEGHRIIASYIMSSMYGNGKVLDREFSVDQSSIANASITNANIRIRNNNITVFVQGKTAAPREVKGTFKFEHNPHLLINNAIGQILGISTSQNVAYITANLTDGTWTLNDLQADNEFWYNKTLETIC